MVAHQYIISSDCIILNRRTDYMPRSAIRKVVPVGRLDCLSAQWTAAYLVLSQAGWLAAPIVRQWNGRSLIFS